MRYASLVIGILLVVLGLVLAAVIGIRTLVLTGNFLNQAVLITVPTEEPVIITTIPAEAFAIMREAAGPHITINRPLLDPPQDLTITITDSAGNPVEATPYEWWTAQQFFGLRRERFTMARFTPTTDPVRVSITGTFAHEQVYSIGPTWALFEQRHGLTIRIGFIIATLLVISGLVLCIIHIARTTTPDPDF